MGKLGDLDQDLPTADKYKEELNTLSKCIALLQPLQANQAERIIVYLQNKFIIHQDFT